MKYAVYANGLLIHVCSNYAGTCKATNWAIDKGYRTRCEEISESETRIIFDARNGNKESTQ